MFTQLCSIYRASKVRSTFTTIIRRAGYLTMSIAPLVISVSILLPSTAHAHLCEKLSGMEMKLTMGRIKSYTITADVLESQETQYSILFNADTAVARVTPPPNGGLQFTRGVFRITAKSVGTVNVKLDWSYSPNNAAGSCLFEIVVNDPAEDRRTAAAHAASKAKGDPVNLWTGELYQDFPPDLYIDAIIPLSFSRYYASGLSADGQGPTTLGRNWLHTYELNLNKDGDRIDIAFQRGLGLRFEKTGADWVLIEPLTTAFKLIEDGADFVLMNPEDWMRWRFNSTGQVVDLRDRNNNTLNFGYAGLNLTTISDAFGNTITLTYAFEQELVSISDGVRTVSFNQLFSGSLREVVDVLGNKTTHNYDADDRLISVTTPEATQALTQSYDASGRVLTQTDSNGNTTTFSYSGKQSTVTNPLAQVEGYEHDNGGAQISEEDAAGNPLNFTYDAASRPTTLTDRLGGVTSKSYHPDSGRLTSYTDTKGDTTIYTWTAQMQGGFTFYNLTSYQLPDSSVTHLVYDANGNITSMTNPLAEVTSFVYNARGQTLTRTTSPGDTTTSTYGANGMLESMQSPDGHLTTLAYDGHRRVTSVLHPDGATSGYTYRKNDQVLTLIDELGETYTYGYDKNGNRTSIENPVGNVSTFTYDGNDRLANVTDALGTTTFTYDELGRLVSSAQDNGEASITGWSETGFPVTLTDGAGESTTFTYDLEGIPTSITNPLNNTWTLLSDAFGNINSVATPLAHVTQYTHDSSGRLAQIVNPLGNDVRFEYGAAGELMAVRLPLGVEVDYTRDALGQIETVTDPDGNLWTRDYDSQGRLLSTTDPLGRTTTYSYDNRGRYDTVTNSDDNLTLGYDGTRRVVQRTYSAGPSLAYTYDGMSRLLSAPGVSFSYDNAGNLSQSNDQSMTFNSAGRLESITYAPGKMVHYTYNVCGLVSEVSDWTGQTTMFTYNTATELEKIERPNAVVTDYAHNADGRLERLVTTRGVVTLASIQLTVDGAGNTIEATRQLPQMSSAAGVGSASYTYDAASQLESATWDANGRRISDPLRTYNWDGANRLTSYTQGGETTSFEYDVFGNTNLRTQGANVNHYIRNFALGTGAVTEIGDGSNTLMYYVYLPNGRLLHAIDASNNAKHFYHFNESGSTIALSDDSGAITDTYASSPYGKLLASSGSTFNPFVFHSIFGVVREDDGLYRMGVRLYDARSASFLSRDVVAVPHPQSVNPYIFANNNPIRFSDAMGAAPNEAPPTASVITPENPGFLSAGLFEVVDRALDYKYMDQIDQAIKHSDQFPSRNPFPVITDAVKTQTRAGRWGKAGNVVGFGIDAFQEGAQAREEGKGWVQSTARGVLGGGVGLALGSANPAVAAIDAVTGENFTHSIKQVYRVPEALLGSSKDGRAYSNAARKGDYGAVVQLANNAGEIYADKGVLDTLGGITAQGFDDTILSLGYAWLGAPAIYTPTPAQVARVRKREEAKRQAASKAEARKRKP